MGLKTRKTSEIGCYVMGGGGRGLLRENFVYAVTPMSIILSSFFVLPSIYIIRFFYGPLGLIHWV